MGLEIKLLGEKEKKSWDLFLVKEGGSFLQSWAWGDFQISLSKKVWRIIAEKERFKMEAQVIRENLPLGKGYFSIYYGPQFNFFEPKELKREFLKGLIEMLKTIAKQEKVIFLRIEPKNSFPWLQNFERQTRRRQPQKTLILNLEKTEEEIKKNFHPKTRYNIKLAHKKKLELEIKTYPDEDFEKFFRLLQETSSRHNFSIYKKEYYYNLLSIKDEFLKPLLFLAKYKNKIVAAHLLVEFGNTLYYLHGGSDYKERALMAPYFLHWKEICWAKEKGLKYFDFWGIDEKKWPGLTSFKKRFGGEEIVYPQGVEFSFQREWYFLYKIIQRLL